MSGAITDNKGNSYADRFVEAVVGWPAWETGIALATNITGGTNHVVTTGSVANDEATLGWDEFLGAGRIGATTSVFRASGSTQISAAVDLDGPGWVVVDWCGDSGTYGAEGFDWTVQAVGEGTTIGTWQVSGQRLKNHGNGWIQWKRWRRYFPTGGTGIQLTINAATLEPTQGARFYATPIQDAFHAGAVLTVPAALATAGSVTRQRTAALTVPAAIATAGTAARQRTAALTIPAAISTVATKGITAAATLTIPATLATATTTTRRRAASLTIGAALATDAVRIPTVAGAASLTIAAQLTTTGALTRNRSVAATLAAQLTTTGTITRRRGATLVITAAIYTNLDNLTAGGGAAADRGVLEAIVADFVDPVADEVDAPPADPDTV